MRIAFTDLKKGTIFQLDETPYKVLDYKQKVMGRGSSTVSVKIKNLLDGKITDKSFKGSENIASADVSSRQIQFLYSDGTDFHFMDAENYEQYSLGEDNVADKKQFLKEGQPITGQFFDGQLINIELPKNIVYKVTHAEEAVRGDTSTAITKNATLETGLVIKVPAFIKQGDNISVDTATGAYRERSKN